MASAAASPQRSACLLYLAPLDQPRGRSGLRLTGTPGCLSAEGRQPGPWHVFSACGDGCGEATSIAEETALGICRVTRAEATYADSLWSCAGEPAGSDLNGDLSVGRTWKPRRPGDRPRVTSRRQVRRNQPSADMFHLPRGSASEVRCWLGNVAARCPDTGSATISPWALHGPRTISCMKRGTVPVPSRAGRPA